MSQNVTGRPPGVSKARILTFVEAGRGLAAIAVVLYHANRFYFSRDDVFPGAPFHDAFLFGHAGVDFFFVLSGFIILNAHVDDIGIPSRIVRFARRRVLRIYPLYIIVLLFVLLISGWSNHLNVGQRNLTDIVGSFLLFGINPHKSIVLVSWTLFHELAFYTAFALLLVNRLFGSIAFAAWILICSLNGYNEGDDLYAISFINVLFVFGMLAFAVSRFLSSIGSVVMIVIGLGSFAYAAIDDVNYHLLSLPAQHLVYGIGSAISLAGFVAFERLGLGRAPDAFLILGRASYALYLSHTYVIAPVSRLMARSGVAAWMPAELGLMLMLIASVIVGVGVHIYVEVPAMRVARRLLEPSSRPVTSKIESKST